MENVEAAELLRSQVTHYKEEKELLEILNEELSLKLDDQQEEGAGSWAQELAYERELQTAKDALGMPLWYYVACFLVNFVIYCLKRTTFRQVFFWLFLVIQQNYIGFLMICWSIWSVLFIFSIGMMHHDSV